MHWGTRMVTYVLTCFKKLWLALVLPRANVKRHTLEVDISAADHIIISIAEAQSLHLSGRHGLQEDDPCAPSGHGVAAYFHGCRRYVRRDEAEKNLGGAEQKFYIDLALLLPIVNIH